MTEILTVARTIEVLEDIVTNAEDNSDPNELQAPGHYAGCIYKDRYGAPVCIVAHFALRIGGKKMLNALRENEDVIQNSLTIGPHEAGVLTLLNTAQRVQDEGWSWEQALEDAKVKAKEIGYLG